MEEKRSEPTVIVQQTPPAYQQQSDNSWKTSSNVRLLIIAFSAIVIVGLVVTGFTLGFKHHADVTETALKTRTETVVDKDIQETIESTDNGLVKVYTVTRPEGTYTVMYDYNKNIRLVKNDRLCAVSPLNSTEVDPQTAYEHHLPAVQGSKVYTLDSMPVRDTSFIGDKGQEICEGKLVYWAMPSCEDEPSPITNTTETGRHKRQAYLLGPCTNCCIFGYRCGFYFCYGGCHYVIEFFYQGIWYCAWYKNC